MKLLTKAIENQLAKYPLYSQDGKRGEAIIVCKFFNPCGSQTWYVLEAEKEDDDYRLFTLYEDLNGREYGHVMLSQLKEIVINPFGLGIERDIYFTPCKVSELN